MLWRFDCLAISLSLACSAGVFFGRANVLLAKSATLKLEKNGENQASLKERERGWGERRFFLPSPSFLLSPQHLPFPTLRVTIFTLPNLPVIRWPLQRYEHKQAAISLHCRLVYHFNKTSVTSQTTEATETKSPKLLSSRAPFINFPTYSCHQNRPEVLFPLPDIRYRISVKCPCVYCNLGLLVPADSVRCFLFQELFIIFIIVSQNKINEQYQNRLKTFEFIDMFYAFK